MCAPRCGAGGEDDMADDPPPFVSLKSLKHGAPDPAAALEEIRRIYFRTSRQTIDNDFAHAVDLLKALPDEETRAKAHVYMEGLAEMRREWAKKPTKVKTSNSKLQSK